MSNSQYNAFKKYIVYAESLQEFCDKWHRPGKVQDKAADYEDHKQDMLKYGETKVMTVWTNGINDRKLIKVRGEFYFVDENGSVYA